MPCKAKFNGAISMVETDIAKVVVAKVAKVSTRGAKAAKGKCDILRAVQNTYFEEAS